MSQPLEGKAAQPLSVEALEERLRYLLRARESLRSGDAAGDELERNRRAIVDTQWELSRSLIARHHPRFQAA